MNHHYPEAAEFFSKALNDAHGENSWEIRLDLGLAQERAGDMAAAKATFQTGLQEVTSQLSKAVQDSGPAASLHSWKGVFYAALGDAGSAIKEGRTAMAMQPTSDDPFEGPEEEERMAMIYALLGNADEAVPIIERLVHTTSMLDTSVGLMYIRPVWDPIRNDPRFQALCQSK
jgi:serine/threonine-protein kinase